MVQCRSRLLVTCWLGYRDSRPGWVSAGVQSTWLSWNQGYRIFTRLGHSRRDLLQTSQFSKVSGMPNGHNLKYCRKDNRFITSGIILITKAKGALDIAQNNCRGATDWWVWSQIYSISQEICTRFLLCCALLWLYIDWFSHIHQAYFTGTVAI